MIKQRDLRRFQVRYHRNGVGGEGFHLCSFLYLRGKDAVYLQAVVFEASGRVAVINPSDIRSRWRGDDFESALREAIKVVETVQPETIYEFA